LYKTQHKEIEIEGERRTVYGAADENGFCYDFTTDADEAERFIDFINQNGVEPCHVCDLIEDLFYSCGQVKSRFIFPE
jgi:hypothetical protein